jgi:hypothetical protein
MEAYGTRLGRIYCDLEHRDLSECTTNDKKVCFTMFICNLDF